MKPLIAAIGIATTITGGLLAVPKPVTHADSVPQDSPAAVSATVAPGDTLQPTVEPSASPTASPTITHVVSQPIPVVIPVEPPTPEPTIVTEPTPSPTPFPAAHVVPTPPDANCQYQIQILHSRLPGSC